MVVKAKPTPGPTATASASASATPTPNSSYGVSAGEQAAANRWKAVNNQNTGAFSLGANAWNGATVFYGVQTRQGRGSGGRIGEVEAQTQAPLWLRPTDAVQDYYNWTPQMRADLRAKGIVSGQLPEMAGDLETAKWWGQLVEQAARYGAAGNQVSPFQLAKGYADAAGFGMSDQERFKQQRGSFPAGAIFDSSGKYTRTYRDGQFVVDEISGTRTYVGPKFKTDTSSRIDLTDPETARAITTSLFQQLVGRDPGEGELGSFAAALARAERAAPVQTTTTREFNSLGEVVNESSTSSGGVTAAGKQQLLMEKLKATPEAGVHQAATTYMNATKNAIWGGPGA